MPADVALQNAEKRVKHWVGKEVAAGTFVPLSTESYGRIGLPTHTVLQMLAVAAIYSAAAGLEVTMSAF
jgi:hypothetical protein